MALPRHTISREQTSASRHLLLFLFRWSKSDVVRTARADAFRTSVSVYWPPVLSAHQGRSATRHHPRLHRARVWNTKHGTSEICTKKKKILTFFCLPVFPHATSREKLSWFSHIWYFVVSLASVGKFPNFASLWTYIYKVHFTNKYTCQCICSTCR